MDYSIFVFCVAADLFGISYNYAFLDTFLNFEQVRTTTSLSAAVWRNMH
jgi:hypothetical protein